MAWWTTRARTLLLFLLLAASAGWWQRSRVFPLSEWLLSRVGGPVPKRWLLSDPGTALTGGYLAAQLNADAVRLGDEQQYREAAERLEEARRLAPADPVITRNLQTVLLNWGTRELADDRLDDARAHLERAAELGARADVLRALGVTYLKQAKYTHATAELEHALQVAPADANTMLALADTYLRQDKRAQALELLERAREAGARGAGLQKTLERLSREVDAEWDFVQLHSRHFRLSFADDEDRRTVRLVLETLEDAYADVGAKFNSLPDEPTTAVLYTQQDFHSVTQTPDWAGAAFDGRIKIPVGGLTADDPNFSRVIRHEYAHSLIARLGGAHCPVWLNEGLAVWAEEVTEADHETWAQRQIADQRLFALAELQGSFTALPRDRVAVAYAQSYLAVRSLIDRYGAHRIPDLLQAVSSTADIEAAFAAVYPGTLASFERQLQAELAG